MAQNVVYLGEDSLWDWEEHVIFSFCMKLSIEVNYFQLIGCMDGLNLVHYLSSTYWIYLLLFSL
jgi:hypothetical protein